jgi:hypothetical protein
MNLKSAIEKGTLPTKLVKEMNPLKSFKHFPLARNEESNSANSK